MRAIDLFAGAGGASLGMHRAGLELVQAVEMDSAACETHRAALPGCPVWEGDIRDWSPPAAELWWAAPPCQAWSSAGKRLGVDDERNGWPWVWNAIDRAAEPPLWLIAENVPGMTHHRTNGCGSSSCPGCYLEQTVYSELRSRFAHVEARILNAADYGVPQARKRLFIVAGPRPYQWPIPTHCDPTAALLLACGRLPWRTMGEALELGSEARAIGGGRNPQSAAVAHKRNYRDLTDEPSVTMTAEQIGNRGPWIEDGSRRRLTVGGCAILQGFPESPWKGNLSQQYRQVGNAVPPPMAEALVQTLSEELGHNL